MNRDACNIQHTNSTMLERDQKIKCFFLAFFSLLPLEKAFFLDFCCSFLIFFFYFNGQNALLLLFLSPEQRFSVWILFPFSLHTTSLLELLGMLTTFWSTLSKAVQSFWMESGFFWNCRKISFVNIIFISL